MATDGLLVGGAAYTSPQGRGHWQDGTSTAVIDVQVERVNDLVVITFTDGTVLQHHLPKVKISSRMIGVPLRLTFIDGTMLTVPDGLLAQELCRGKAAWASMVEGNLIKLILPLLLGAAGVMWVFVNYGLPPLAKTIAHRIPVSFANSLGNEAFESIASDIDLLDQDSAHTEQQGLLQKLGVEAVTQGTGQPPGPEGYHYQFYLASGKHMGVNAFALPSGQIIMSKLLLDLLTEDETFAVLAHEVGHVEKRHSLQAVVRSAAWYFIGALLFNDYLFVLVPAILTEMSYSREHETEVDCYAANVLLLSDRDPNNIISAIKKIEASPDRQEDDDVKEELEVLKRERNKKNPDLPGVPEHDPLTAPTATETDEATEEAEEEESGLQAALTRVLSSHPRGEAREERIRDCTYLPATNNGS